MDDGNSIIDPSSQYRKMEDTTLDALFANKTDEDTNVENQQSTYQQMQDENNIDPSDVDNTTDNDEGAEEESTPYQQMQDDEEQGLASPYSFEKVASTLSQKSQEMKTLITQKSQEMAEIMSQKSQEAIEVVKEQSQKAAVVVQKKSKKAAKIVTKQSKKAAVALSHQGNQVVSVLSEQSLLPPMGEEKERDLSRYAALLAALIMAAIFYTTWFIFELAQFLPDLTWDNDGLAILLTFCVIVVGILASVLFVRVMRTKQRLALSNPASQLARRRSCPSRSVRMMMAVFCLIASTGYVLLYWDTNPWTWFFRWFPWFVAGLLVLRWKNSSIDEMDDFDRMMIRENEKEDPTGQILKISTF